MLDPSDADAPSDEAADPLVGQQLGHYRIEARIGHGGMGVVYLASDSRLGRAVAIKALAPHLTAGEERRKRLWREARAAAALSHPGIATIYAIEEFDGSVYLVSEYIRGRTLREELADGPLAPAHVISTAIAIGHALVAAHEHGVVHRDLKPDNIIRTDDGRVKILDFGLALLPDSSDARDARLTQSGAILGTPAYMAPEQLRGRTVDARADQFALGLVMYELATGHHPFAGDDMASMMAHLLQIDGAAIASRLPGSEMLRSIVARCLAKDPADRYPSSRDLVRALEAAASSAATTPAARDSNSAVRANAVPPLWWWRFHQMASIALYVAMLWPIWLVRAWLPDGWSAVTFFAAVVAVAAATTLRMHLWFTSRVYPSEWAEQRERASPWIRLADVFFVALLMLSAIAITASHAGIAAVFAGVGIAVLVAFTIIEPATTRVAFRD